MGQEQVCVLPQAILRILTEPSYSAQYASHEETVSTGEAQSEDFDFLVVASGYFARPYIPQIPGLENFTEKVVHSSSIRTVGDSLFNNRNWSATDNVVIIGGSMSGVEAASAAALSQSSALIGINAPLWNNPMPVVHHVHSRPFWTLPTYLPNENPDGTVSFLPLDLALYDLGRRPPGPIEYAIGPIPVEKAAKTNSYFSSLLGPEYEKIGHIHAPSTGSEATSQPPWVAISNEYAEYVRSGAIQPTMGRVVSVHANAETGLASIDMKKSDGQLSTIDNVSLLVMATGFTPFESLSFLPTDVLSALEYCDEDPFLPLVLDQGGTLRSEVEDLGFVGFYRGPYWGVMEMQARFLGETWANRSSALQATHNQRQSLRILRDPETKLRRGQFPMGDYVGLMESFARALGLNRAEMSAGGIHADPVVPSRYSVCREQGDEEEENEEEEEDLTCSALHWTYAHDYPTRKGAAAATMAIFRALQGTWRFTRWSNETELSGFLVFHPRHPSNREYDREYICEGYQEPSTHSSEHLPDCKSRSMLRLSLAGTTTSTSRIEIHFLNPLQKSEAGCNRYGLDITPFYREKEKGEPLLGRYVIYAQSDDLERRYHYTFHLHGVSITNWECIDRGYTVAEANGPIEPQTVAKARTRFVR